MLNALQKEQARQAGGVANVGHRKRETPTLDADGVVHLAWHHLRSGAVAGEVVWLRRLCQDATAKVPVSAFPRVQYVFLLHSISVKKAAISPRRNSKKNAI